jgi:hypothetical protein
MAAAGVHIAETATRPLISSKLQPPVPRPRVPRPALLKLCTGAHRKLTLIPGPGRVGQVDPAGRLVGVRGRNETLPG